MIAYNLSETVLKIWPAILIGLMTSAIVIAVTTSEMFCNDI